MFFHFISLFIQNHWVKTNLKKLTSEELKNARQLFFTVMTMVFVGTILFEPIKKDSKLKEIPKFLFIQSEYYPNSYCKNLTDKNILVSDIGGGLYSVYNIQSSKLTVSKCDIELTKTVE
jgi:hypothetical protein